MLTKINLEHLVFLDIETVPEHQHYEEVDDAKKTLWAEKTAYKRKDEITAEAYYDNAGIWAEFGRIICISVGYFHFK